MGPYFGEGRSSGKFNLEMPSSRYQCSRLGFPCEKQVLLGSLECALGSIPGSFVLGTKAGEGLLRGCFQKNRKSLLWRTMVRMIRGVASHLEVFCFGFEVSVYVSHAHLWQFSELAPP